MAKTVKFKHFKHNSENGLCEELQEWVNGETIKVNWIEETSFLEGSDNKWHCFVKYIEE